jgi:hypothetical protein
MSVFVWQAPVIDLDLLSGNAFATAWAMPAPECLFCEDPLVNGEDVFHYVGAGREVIAHARCVALNAPGLRADIDECIRRTPY